MNFLIKLFKKSKKLILCKINFIKIKKKKNLIKNNNFILDINIFK